NPRPTGALPVFSFITMWQAKVPPMEFFHLFAHLGREDFFDIEAVNREMKKTLPVSHISLTPFGIPTMTLNMKAGVYSFDEHTQEFSFQRAGLFPWDIKKEN